MDFDMADSSFEFSAAGADSFSSDQLSENARTSPGGARGKKRSGPGGPGGARGSRGPARGGAPAVGGAAPTEAIGGFESITAKAEESGIIEKVIQIKRVTKVTKGGKKMSFTALVVVGDTKGRVGFNLSKGSEVSLAIKKAMNTAKKNMIQVSLKDSTIPHEIIGECGASRVLLKPAAKGTGVIAAGPVRAICDGAGIRDILSKCHRSNNPVNVIKATFDGLNRLKKVIQTEQAEVPAAEAQKG